jgi:hypothetical protein
MRSGTGALRLELLSHRLYGMVRGMAGIQIFLESHVFAVWDFMSLVKRLQRDLTCVGVPWVPVGEPESRHLINEIVCGEESDVDEEGRRCSHFELYLRAMDQAGAKTDVIRRVVKEVGEGRPFREIVEYGDLPAGVVEFTGYNLRLAETGATHEVAAAFTYGREDVIPEMFLPLVNRLEADGEGRLSILQYYLERHLEVDGGQHGAMARRMTNLLCGGDPRKVEAAWGAARRALEHRIRFWDAIARQIEEQSKKYPLGWA